MTLLIETLVISGSILVLSGVPLFSSKVREHSKLFFLLGTGALTGLLLFDLMPDLFHLGGTSSLWGVGLVWLGYSLLHLYHLRQHKGFHAGHGHTEVSNLFLASMIAHCLASGMLLVLSSGMAGTIHRTVFLALLAHKAYEALTVSSILVEKRGSKASALASIALYAASLPVGVSLTLCFRAELTQSVAVVATSLAVGTLLGCLSFDFLLPSIAHIRGRHQRLAWVFIGLGLTQIVMRLF